MSFTDVFTECNKTDSNLKVYLSLNSHCTRLQIFTKCDKSMLYPSSAA